MAKWLNGRMGNTHAQGIEHADADEASSSIEAGP